MRYFYSFLLASFLIVPFSSAVANSTELALEGLQTAKVTSDAQQVTSAYQDESFGNACSCSGFNPCSVACSYRKSAVCQANHSVCLEGGRYIPCINCICRCEP